MKDLSTALNALIRSTSLRRGILAGAGERAEQAAVRAGLSPETSARLRARVEGTGDAA